MEVEYSQKALLDIQYYKESGNVKLMKKIQSVIEDMSQHPRTGIGKPEALKGDLSGLWSRRINQEHRIVYEINFETNTITIFSMKGHYTKIF